MAPKIFFPISKNNPPAGDNLSKLSAKSAIKFIFSSYFLELGGKEKKNTTELLFLFLLCFPGFSPRKSAVESLLHDLFGSYRKVPR